MSHHLGLSCAIVAVLLLVQAAVLYLYVWPRLKVFITAHNAEMAQATAKTQSVFTGVKTVLTGVVGSIVLAIPEFATELKAVDLSATKYAVYAPVVAIVCIITMSIFHASTVKTATATPPQ